MNRKRKAKAAQVLVDSHWLTKIMPRTFYTLRSMPKNRLVNSYFFRGSYGVVPRNRVSTAGFDSTDDGPGQ